MSVFGTSAGRQQKVPAYRASTTLPIYERRHDDVIHATVLNDCTDGSTSSFRRSMSIRVEYAQGETVTGIRVRRNGGRESSDAEDESVAL